VRDCPWGDGLHYHEDGCGTCKIKTILQHQTVSKLEREIDVIQLKLQRIMNRLDELLLDNKRTDTVRS